MEGKDREANVLKVLVTGTKNGKGDMVYKDVFMAILVSSSLDEDANGSKTQVAILKPGINMMEGEYEEASKEQLEWSFRHYSSHIALVEAMHQMTHGEDMFMTKAEAIRATSPKKRHTKTIDHQPTDEDWDGLSNDEST